jgi:hypothetical protein
MPVKGFFNQVEDGKKEQELMQIKFIDKGIINSIRNKYIKSQNRLSLIDYDGTLTPITMQPELAILTEKTLSILKEIVLDKRNVVA